MREIDRLRAEAKRANRRVGNKISRIKSTYGVALSGSENDPRTSAANIDRMNSRQVRAYLNRANQFTSRDTGFVQGAKGAIIPLREWRAYKAVEQRYNKIADAHMAKFNDLVIPGSTMTVAQRNAEILANRPARAMATAASNKPLASVNRESVNIPSVEALNKLRRDLERRMDSKFYGKALAKARKNAMAMIDAIPDEETAKEFRSFVKGRSDEEFDFLWNYGKLADQLSLWVDSDQKWDRLDPGFQNMADAAKEEMLGDDWREFFTNFRKGER